MCQRNSGRQKANRDSEGATKKTRLVYPKMPRASTSWIEKVMRTTRASGFACVVLLAGAAPAVAQEPFPDDVLDSAPLFLQETFGHANAGMVIAMVDQRGSRVFAAGKLDNGTDRRIDGDTVFEIGSVTKVFTVLLLMDAVRRGEMSLDDPLAKHLPQIRIPNFYGKEITLLNLAVQDSGLPFFPDNLGPKPVAELSLRELKMFSDAYTTDKLYAFLNSHKLSMAPGTRFEYSNVGMALLGHAIERRTGLDYEQLLAGRICRPLEMSDSSTMPSGEMKTRLAVGHLADGARAEHWQLQAMASAGAMLSTANDFVKFLAANLGFTQSHFTPLMIAMQENRHTGAPVLGNTAMPWVDERVYHPPGSDLRGHAGGGYGTIAFIAFDKKKRRGVVVLTNQMKVYPNGVGWTLLQGRPLSGERSGRRRNCAGNRGADWAPAHFRRLSTITGRGGRSCCRPRDPKNQRHFCRRQEPERVRRHAGRRLPYESAAGAVRPRARADDHHRVDAAKVSND
jgi:CubicO group peptidase (beta-lactamase class C family)